MRMQRTANLNRDFIAPPSRFGDPPALDLPLIQ
jgi:hypothetical protein